MKDLLLSIPGYRLHRCPYVTVTPDDKTCYSLRWPGTFPQQYYSNGHQQHQSTLYHLAIFWISLDPTNVSALSSVIYGKHAVPNISQTFSKPGFVLSACLIRILASWFFRQISHALFSKHLLIWLACDADPNCGKRLSFSPVLKLA